MERLLARLERSVGRHVPEGLPAWLTGLTALGYIATFAKPELAAFLRLDAAAVLRGEAWRLVTFLFAPLMPIRQPVDFLWVFFGLQIFYMMASSLEAQWGAFRFTVFWLIGALCAMAAGLVTGGGSSMYLAASVLLAFATLFPDYELMIFFVLPVKVKWLGILSGAGLVWAFVTGSMSSRGQIVAGVLNYLLFCGPALTAKLRGARRSPARRTEAFAEPARKRRVCAKCGRSEAEDPSLEFRVCDCQERCHGRLTEYCLEHARNH